VPVGLALADLDTRYVRVNDAFAALVGRRHEDLIGLPFTAVLHENAPPGQHTSVEALLAGSERTLSAEVPYAGPDGGELWVLHSMRVVRDASGGPLWFAVSAQDITERRKAEQDLRDLTAAMTERAVRDPLTGLANRALLEERLRGALARDARSGGRTGLLFLDLDGFKEVNDAHGHATGDTVLRTVARRLVAGVRPSDTVARLGGDEFVVLVEGVSEEGLAPLVKRLEEAVREPLALGADKVQVGVSIGAAVSVRGEDDGPTLLGLADRAMYQVKRAHDRR
jgi:diguanylate cyclase (GGDEF)-like protein/PAS domain S-box-containing protein